MFGKTGVRPPAAIAAALIAAILIAACGGSSESGSEQFRDKTDSATLDFGEEASEAQREEAADAVQAYLTARANGDWPAACSQLSRAALAKIEQLATSSTQLEDTSCSSFLGAFTQLSADERKDVEVDAGSLRQQGRQGYLIYYGPGEAVFAMPLSREGDVWKVASLSPKLLS